MAPLEKKNTGLCAETVRMTTKAESEHATMLREYERKTVQFLRRNLFLGSELLFIALQPVLHVFL